MSEHTPGKQDDTQPAASTLLPFSGRSYQEPANSDSPYRWLEHGNLVDLTLFVACYNEEKNILATLDVIAETMSELSLRYEMIVIDDGSTDRSAELVQDYQSRFPMAPLVLVRNERNRGLSRNFVEAAFMGRGRHYKLICGDNVEPKENLLAVFKLAGQADLIIPYHREIVGRSRLRRALSKTYTTLVNLLSGQSLRYYNGCGLYRRVDVMRWHARTSGFGFQAELLTQLLSEGASFVEVPVTAMERQGGSSTAMKLRNWLSVGNTLLTILLCRLRAQRARRRAEQAPGTARKAA